MVLATIEQVTGKLEPPRVNEQTDKGFDRVTEAGGSILKVLVEGISLRVE